MDRTTQTSALIAQVSTPVSPPATPTPSGLDWTIIIVAVTTGVIGIVTGVTTGWITAVYAPKANWNVEKKKLEYERKREIINGLREALRDETITASAIFNHADFGYVERELDAEDRERAYELRESIQRYFVDYYEHKYNIDPDNIMGKYSLDFVEKAQEIYEDRMEIVNAISLIPSNTKLKRIIRKTLDGLERKWGLVD